MVCAHHLIRSEIFCRIFYVSELFLSSTALTCSSQRLRGQVLTLLREMMPFDQVSCRQLALPCLWEAFPECSLVAMYAHNYSLSDGNRNYRHYNVSYCAFHAAFVTLRGGKKCKAIPLQAWSGPEGSRKLRFPDFMTTAQDSGKVVSPMHRPPLPPGNTPGTHFCYRLSRPLGHSAIGTILC